jgi:hypothetical protein
MTSPPPTNLFTFTDRVRSISGSPTFSAFVQPLTSKPGVTDAYIDALCIRFLASRKGDVETAAPRFVAFTRAVIDHDLSFALDADIITGLSQSFMLFLTPSGDVNTDSAGRPVIHFLPRNVDYSKASVRQMKKTWFFVLMNIAFSCPAAQQLGIVVVNNLKDSTRAAFNMEFQGERLPAKFVPTPAIITASARNFLPCLSANAHHQVSSPKPYPAQCRSKCLQCSSCISPACSASFGHCCPPFYPRRSKDESEFSAVTRRQYLQSWRPVTWLLSWVGVWRWMQLHARSSYSSCSSSATAAFTRISFNERRLSAIGL